MLPKPTSTKSRRISPIKEVIPPFNRKLIIGKITHVHKLVKAVTAEFPEDSVSTLDAHPAVEEIEADKTVTTQV
jgi:hypothetical protein